MSCGIRVLNGVLCGGGSGFCGSWRTSCSEKTIPPLFKGGTLAWQALFLVEKSANTDRPPIGFCNDWLIAPNTLVSCAVGLIRIAHVAV